MIRYACGVCRRVVTDYRVSVRPDGKLSLVACCHGAEHEFVVSLDMQGVVFAGSTLSFESRFPDDWIGPDEKEGTSPARRTG